MFHLNLESDYNMQVIKLLIEGGVLKSSDKVMLAALYGHDSDSYHKITSDVCHVTHVITISYTRTF